MSLVPIIPAGLRLSLVIHSVGRSGSRFTVNYTVFAPRAYGVWVEIRYSGRVASSGISFSNRGAGSKSITLTRALPHAPPYTVQLVARTSGGREYFSNSVVVSS